MTRDVFDQLAASWYNYRHWTIFRNELEVLSHRWQQGRLLNIGCGHGPDFLPFRTGFELHGVDFSIEMLKLALKYSQKFNFDVNLVQADISKLPYSDQTFDWAIAVATYHHLKDKETRLEALEELRRVLKPGAEAFITTWNRLQPRFWLHPKEVDVPWRTREKTFYRYYYLFSYPELERLVKKVGFKLVKSFPESSYRFPAKYFSRNICLLIRKNS